MTKWELFQQWWWGWGSDWVMWAGLGRSAGWTCPASGCGEGEQLCVVPRHVVGVSSLWLALHWGLNLVLQATQAICKIQVGCKLTKKEKFTRMLPSCSTASSRHTNLTNTSLAGLTWPAVSGSSWTRMTWRQAAMTDKLSQLVVQEVAAGAEVTVMEKIYSTLTQWRPRTGRWRLGSTWQWWSA